MSDGITLDQAKGHRAVIRYVEERDSRFLVVRPYGNAVLMNALAQSENVKLGNIAIRHRDVDDTPNLKVHVSER